MILARGGKVNRRAVPHDIRRAGFQKRGGVQGKREQGLQQMARLSRHVSDQEVVAANLDIAKEGLCGCVIKLAPVTLLKSKL